MTQLYPAQQRAVNQLIKAYRTPNHISNQHLFVSGEMGVGKTYIASKLAHDLGAKRVLIVSPKTVTTKWQRIFNEFNSQLSKPAIVHSSRGKIINTDADISIVTPRDLKRYLEQKFTEFDFEHFEDIVNIYIRDNSGLRLSSNDYAGLIERLQKLDLVAKSLYDLVIVDEVHTFKAKTNPFLGLIFLNLSLHTKIINLTGTIYNQNLSRLADLLMISNTKAVNYALGKISNLSYHEYPALISILHRSDLFYTLLFKYIAVQISLNDVKNNLKRANEDEIKQTIVPPISIALSNEQQTWIELATYQLNHLNRSPRKLNEIINNYLDYPSQAQPTITIRRKLNATNSGREKLTVIRKSYVGLQLTPIELKDTPKFQQVLDIKAKYPTAKTLIFVNTKNLAKKLAQKLPKAKSLPASVRANEYSKYINNALANGTDIFVVTPRQISVGVDITTADQIIWYQIPEDVAKIIQAQRRIYRLNSTKSSRIFYLYYAGTYQEEIIKQVSQASVKNAGSYNVRTTDNLAKITHILLPEIK